MVATPLPVVYPLSSGEVQEFLAFYAPQEIGPYRKFGHRDKVIMSTTRLRNTEGVFWSLSGVTQGLIWRVRQSGAISDLNLMVALGRYNEKTSMLWKDLPSDHVVADNLLRSWLLVAERIHADHPHLIKSMDAGAVQRILEDSVGNFFYKGRNIVKIRELETVEEVAAVAGIAVYLMTALDEDATYVTEQVFYDRGSRLHTALAPRNKTLADYIKARPEQALRIGEIVVGRNVGKHKLDAEMVLEQLALDAPAMSDGFL